MRTPNPLQLFAVTFFSLAFVCFASRAAAKETRACLLPEDSETKAPPSPTATNEAIRLFREATLLEQAEKKEEAVKKFLESRRLVPRKTNSTNAARLLQDLGRSDEALALFERILEEFDAVLSPIEKQAIRDRIAQLKPRVLTLHFAPDAGDLVVDGNRCGRLPRRADLYVLAGKHELSLTRGADAAVYQLVAGAGLETRLVRFPALPTPIADADRWTLSFSAGLVLGPGMASGPELDARASCGENCPFALGGMVLGRLEQDLGRGFSIGVGTGYLEASSSFYREEERPFQGTNGKQIRYGFDETMRLRGPMMGLLLAYRFTTGRLSWSTHHQIGLFSAQSVDEFSSANTLPVPGFLATRVIVSGDPAVRSVTPFVMPDIGVDMSIYGRLRLGVSLGVMVLFAEGAQLNRRLFGVEPAGCDAPGLGEVQTNPACAQWPDSSLERGLAHGITYFVHPQLVLRISP